MTDYKYILKTGYNNKQIVVKQYNDGKIFWLSSIDKIKPLSSGKASRIMKDILKYGNAELKNDIKSKLRSVSNDKLGNYKLIRFTNTDSVFDVRDKLKDFIKRGTYNIYLKAGNFETYKIAKYSGVGFYNWFNTNAIRIFMYNSEISLFEKYGAGYIELYKGNKFNNDDTFKTVYKQKFLDGITHCVFTPIRNFIEEKIENSKTEKTKKNYNCKLKHLEELEYKYSSGVPEDKLNEVANKLNIDIIVNTPFSNETFIEAKCMKNKLTTFHFMNTRLDHVDHNKIVSTRSVNKNNNTEILNSDDMKKLYKELVDNDKYFVYRVNHTGVSEIQTLNKIYKLDCNYKKAVKKFENENDIQNYKNIDAYKEVELTEFMNQALHFNGTVDLIENPKLNVNLDDVEHIDMKNAYINSNKNKYYQGFLGKITDYRKCNKEFALKHIGMYRIVNIKLSDTIALLNDKLGLFYEYNIYTTPELKFLVDNKCKFEVIEGCWGFSAEINLDVEYMKEKNNGIKNYCKYFGNLCNTEFHNSFFMNCDEEFAKICKKNFNGKVEYFDNKALFTHQNKYSFHGNHIATFITAYQRLYMIQQVLEMDINKIVRICVDGIYYYKHKFNMMELFRQKNDEKTFNNGNTGGYLLNVFTMEYTELEGYRPITTGINEKVFVNKNNKYLLCKNEFKEFNEVEFHLGGGGCGKTYSNCKDDGSIRKCIFTHSHDLGIEAKEKYGINYMTHARLFMDNEIMNIKKYYNTLIVDEVSMLSEESIKSIIKKFKGCKIIFMGDIGYQVKPIKGDEITNFGKYYVKRYTTDYRCKCAKLAVVKKLLRDNINKTGKRQLEIIKPYCNVVNEITNYDKEDIILVSKHTQNDEWKNIFQDIPKYKVIENNAKYNVGQIVYDSNIKCKKEFRHGYTVHSVQGRTFTKKIYIDCRSLYDERLLYTAVSRANYLEQIYLVC